MSWFSKQPKKRKPYRNPPLQVEGLERRDQPAVLGSFSASDGVFTITGDAAINKIDVEISSGYVTVWNNSAYVQGTSQVALGSVKQLKIAAKDGNDTVNVVQKVEWLTGDVFVYGDNGNDTINVDVRSQGAAKYTVFGNAGSDTVNVPNWLPVSLTTPDETPVLQRLAKAQQELRNQTLHPEMKNLEDQVKLTGNVLTNSPGARSADAYRNVIDQFDVGYSSAGRYRPGSGSYNVTRCNIFATDVMAAMGVSLPTRDNPSLSGAKKAYSANEINDWLNKRDNNGNLVNGWIKVDKNNATQMKAFLDAVKAGKPGLASYKNGSGASGHIAVVRPDQDPNFVLTANTMGNLLIAQAGGTNSSKFTLYEGFGTTDSRNNVEFFYRG